MEDMKYWKPKFSHALIDLAKYYNTFEKGRKLPLISKQSSKHSISAHSDVSKNVDEPNNFKSTHSLKTIQEMNVKKSIPRIKHRYQSTIKSRAKALSKRFPSLSKGSRSRSKTRSRSKSKSHHKSNSKINKVSQSGKMK